MTETTPSIPTAGEIKHAIVAETQRLCRAAFQDGLRQGYVKGFEAGASAMAGAIPKDPAMELAD